jgi:stearoyl-CoA desaturase (delta-9 desaturase)
MMLLSAALSILAGIATAQTSLFLTSIYLHRTETHRALVVSRPFGWFARTWLWFTTGVTRRDWVTVHRAHHRYCETDRDPHSPRHSGRFGVLFGTAVLYRNALRRLDRNHWTHDIRPDRFDRFTERLGATGPVIAVIALVVVFGPWVALWWALAHAGAYLIGGGLVNSLGHVKLSGRGEVEPRNSFLAALWCAGEGNHEGHHDQPTSPRFRGPYPDTAWWAIRVLMAFRLVSLPARTSAIAA